LKVYIPNILSRFASLIHIMASADEEKIPGKLKAQLFMLKAAKEANPQRFFPFPRAFRTAKGKVPDGLPASFEGYSDADYNNVKSVLDYFTPAILKRTHDEGPDFLSDAHRKLYDDIFDVGLKIYANDDSSNGMPGVVEYCVLHSEDENTIRDMRHPGKRYYIFHGTPASNLFSIMRTGIKITSKTSLMTTGAVYGDGLYATPDISIARGYASPMAGRSYVLILELVDCWESHKKTEGIYVLPPDLVNRARVYSVLEVLGGPRGGEDFLRQLSETSVGLVKANPVPAARMAKELKLIAEHRLGIQIVDSDYEKNKYITVLLCGLLCRVYVHKFPFSKPLIYFPYKLHTHIDLVSEEGIYQRRVQWRAMMKITELLEHVAEDLEGHEMTKQENPPLQ